MSRWLLLCMPAAAMIGVNISRYSARVLPRASGREVALAIVTESCRRPPGSVYLRRAKRQSLCLSLRLLSGKRR